MYVSIGYQSSSLDMVPCTRIRRLGAILGRGAGTSTIRVRVRVRVFGEQICVDTHVNILEGRAYMSVLDIDYQP